MESVSGVRAWQLIAAAAALVWLIGMGCTGSRQLASLPPATPGTSTVHVPCAFDAPDVLCAVVECDGAYKVIPFGGAPPACATPAPQWNEQTPVAANQPCQAHA